VQFNRTANKGNRNNNDTDKEKTQHKPHNPQSHSRTPPPRAPETQETSYRAAPLTGTQHDGT